MGYLTLNKFRDILNISLGESRQTGNERLDAWINLGYFDVATLTEFEGLKMVASMETVASQRSYSLPDDLISIISVADLTNKRRMVFLGLHNYHLKDREVENNPRYYARRKRVMYLWPTPASVLDVEVYYLEEPCPLQEGDDVTIFPMSYDTVVLNQARYHAFLSLGQEQKAYFYEELVRRAIPRLSSDAEEGEQVTAGVNIATSFDDLSVMQTSVPK